MNGIITIAVGDTVYGRLASNLAISIKHKSSTPICLIYTKSAFDGQEHLLELFDHKQEVPNTDSPTKLSMKLKVELNSRTPFERTIFLDADNIMTPTHSVNEWFESLWGVDFTAFNNSIYSLNEEPYEHYRHWCDPQVIKNHFLLTDEHKIPQINSSFLYWEKCAESDEVFSKAKFVMKSGLKHETFRGEFPDELAFNVACCITKTLPHKKTFKPLFLYIVSANISKEYIIENFACMSVIGSSIRDGRIREYYNDFVDYYSDMAGLIKKNHYEPKIKDTQDRRIFGFYHICMINHYESIVREQVNDLVSSGLYQASEKIFVVLAGSVDNSVNVRKILKRYPKFEIRDVTDIRAYEFPTINLVKKHCETDERQFVYYIHTKGVSFPNHAGGAHWRKYMMHYNVSLWRDCVSKLKEGYEMCGCKLFEEKRSFPMHYSGNFWWARSEYIQRCPPVTTLNQTDRFEAEFWVCKGNPNASTLCQTYIDYDKNPPFK